MHWAPLILFTATLLTKPVDPAPDPIGSTANHTSGPALAARFAHSSRLVLTGDYVLTAPLTVPTGCTLAGSARISADPAAGLCHLIRLEAGSAIEGCLTMDGTALQPPLVGWTEADGPPGGVALVIEGRPHQLIDDVRVNGCQFENFPSGAIYARHTRHVSLSGLSARMMQTKAPKETCAVFAFYDSVMPSITECRIEHYRWKGFYFKNCLAASCVDSFARHGPPDHASHYARFCQDTLFRGGGTEDGFGLKTFGCQQVRVEGMTMLRTPTGIFIDATEQSYVKANRIIDSSQQGIIVGGEDGYLATSDCQLTGNQIATSVPGTSTNSCGVQLVSFSPRSPVRRVTLRDNDIAGYLWAVGFLPGGGRSYGEVQIMGNRFTRIRQYGIVGPAASLVITENEIALESPAAQSFIAVWPGSGPSPGELIVRRNRLRGPRDYGIQLGTPEQAYQRVFNDDNRYVQP